MIKKSELMSVLSDGNLPESKIDDIMSQVDQKGDGVISFEEFTNFMRNYI
jgi:Ca2+-binding EF-hand superfamily protein